MPRENTLLLKYEPVPYTPTCFCSLYLISVLTLNTTVCRHRVQLHYILGQPIKIHFLFVPEEDPSPIVSVCPPWFVHFIIFPKKLAGLIRNGVGICLCTVLTSGVADGSQICPTTASCSPWHTLDMNTCFHLQLSSLSLVMETAESLPLGNVIRLPLTNTVICVGEPV